MGPFERMIEDCMAESTPVEWRRIPYAEIVRRAEAGDAAARRELLRREGNVDRLLPTKSDKKAAAKVKD